MINLLYLFFKFLVSMISDHTFKLIKMRFNYLIKHIKIHS